MHFARTPLVDMRVHELVVAAGFLGASLSLLDFSSGSTPPQPSIEELLLISLLIRRLLRYIEPVAMLWGAVHGLHSSGAKEGGLVNVVTSSCTQASGSALAKSANPVLRPIGNALRARVA